MSRSRIADIFLLAALFLLPFQTRWIFHDLTLVGQVWEYGRMSVYGTELLVLVAALLRGRPRIPFRLVPFSKGIVLMLGALLISASWSVNVGLSLGFLQHVVAAVALFSLIVDERTRLRDAAVAFVAGLLVPCGLAWWQALTGTSPSSSWLGLAAHDAATLGASVIETGSDRILRGYGTFPHPNIFGGYLVVGLLVVGSGLWVVGRESEVGLVVGSESFVEKERPLATHHSPLTNSLAAAILASTLVLTFSRSSWIAFAVGGFAFVVCRLSSRPTTHNIQSTPPDSPLTTHHKRLTISLLLPLFAILATLAIFHTPAFTRFQPAARLEAKSIAERSGEYPVWDDVARLNPVTGVGPGNYTAALATLYPGRDAYAYQPIHNAFLLFLAETGLFGLFAAARLVREGSRLFRPWNWSAGYAIGTSLLCALVVLASLDHYLWSLWPGLVLGAFALAFVLKMIVSPEEK